MSRSARGTVCAADDLPLSSIGQEPSAPPKFRQRDKSPSGGGAICAGHVPRHSACKGARSGTGPAPIDGSRRGNRRAVRDMSLSARASLCDRSALWRVGVTAWRERTRRHATPQDAGTVQRVVMTDTRMRARAVGQRQEDECSPPSPLSHRPDYIQIEGGGSGRNVIGLYAGPAPPPSGAWVIWRGAGWRAPGTPSVLNARQRPFLALPDTRGQASPDIARAG